MKLIPIAVCRNVASPSAGAGNERDPNRMTEGGPCVSMTIARAFTMVAAYFCPRRTIDPTGRVFRPPVSISRQAEFGKIDRQLYHLAPCRG